MMKNIYHTFTFLLLIILLCNAKTSIAQTERVVDLKSKLREASNEKEKVIALQQLAFEYINFKPDSLEILTKEALKISIDINWKLGIANSENLLGFVKLITQDSATGAIHLKKAKKLIDELYSSKGKEAFNDILMAKAVNMSYSGIMQQIYGNDPQNALDQHLTSLMIKEELKDKNQIAFEYRNVGNAYILLSKNVNALSYFIKALKIDNETGNLIEAASDMKNIAKMYTEQLDFDKAIKYRLKVYEIEKEMDNVNNFSETCYELGLAYNLNKDSENALIYLNKSLELITQIDPYHPAIATINTLLGKTYAEIDSLDKALSILNSSIENLFNVDQKQHSIIYLILADIYSKRENYDRARFYFNEAELNFKAWDNLLKLFFYEKKSQFYEQNNQVDLAYSYFKKYIELKNSMDQETNGVKQDALIENYELEKTEIEEKAAAEKLRLEQINLDNINKAALDRKNSIQVAGICVFIVLLISFIIMLSQKEVNPKMLKFLGTFSVLVIFEFIAVILHPAIIELTHHDLVLTLMCTVGIALIIVPAHHKVEHHFVQRLVNRKKKAE